MTPSPDAVRVQALEKALTAYVESHDAEWESSLTERGATCPCRECVDARTALLSAAGGEPSPGGQRETAERFWREIWGRFADGEGAEIEAEEFLEVAEECGLVVQEPYEPEGKHKDLGVWGDSEAGDLIYVLAPSAPLPTPPAPPDLQRGVIDRILKDWEDAYPEDVFAPIRPDEKDVSRDRVAASMGRHMAKALRAQFAAALRATTPTQGEGD